MIRQKRSGGQYYSEFMANGRRYYGACENCTTKRAAEAYEKKIRAVVTKASEQKNVRVLIENFRDELSGGVKIGLADAFERSLLKPHRKKSSEQVKAQKREAFRDFVAFMSEKYPNVKDLASVQKKHAEEYIGWISEYGRFQKNVCYVRNGKQISRQTGSGLSARTVNLYLTTAKEVFRLLAQDAGLVDNPFDITTIGKSEETREAFSNSELKMIFENLDDFTRPLFTMAITTALREGDICTLKWSDINFRERVLRRIMNKTGYMVEIPLSGELYDYLMDQKNQSGDSEYVFPQHAAMYQTNRSGVSYRVKGFLEGIGIKTTRIPKGRSRAVSVKDLHSCRHTFCYYAGLRGIPLAVVQSIVGHMTPEMTKHYTAHATMEDKRRNMLAMSNLVQLTTAESDCHIERTIDTMRQDLHDLIETLPKTKLEKLIACARKL